MAEHMLILKLTSPEASQVHNGRVSERLRQDQPGNADPTLEGWTVETIGDDIAWMKFGEDGRFVCDQSRGRLLRRRAGYR